MISDYRFTKQKLQCVKTRIEKRDGECSLHWNLFTELERLEVYVVDISGDPNKTLQLLYLIQFRVIYFRCHGSHITKESLKGDFTTIETPRPSDTLPKI